MDAYVDWMDKNAPRQQFQPWTEYICFLIDHCICVPQKKFLELYAHQVDEMRRNAIASSKSDGVSTQPCAAYI